jgi:protein SCO1/2
MKFMLSMLLLTMLVATGSVPLRAAQDNTGTTHPPVGILEKLGQTLPLGVTLYDENGYPVVLKDVVRHPTIFTFVYYRCPGICSPLLTELSRMVDKVDLEIGKDYQIVTISFDYREKPPLAGEKKTSYMSSLKHPIDPAGWRFFTADSATIMQLTDAAGFYFMRSGNDYVHAGALIVTSPEGKITRYINGVQYLPFDIKMAVMEAAEGRTGPTIAKLLQYCYRYDPDSQSYTMNITRVGGIVVVVAVMVFVLVFIVLPKKRKSER